MTNGDEEKIDYKQRAKRLWIFVLISGILHLYIGTVFITTDIMQYRLLSTLFIWAFVTNGICEVLFRYLVFRTPDAQRVFAPVYDIIAGVFIYVFPLFSVLILPVYLALSLLIRGTTDLVVSQRVNPHSLLSIRFLKTVGCLRIVMATLILVVALLVPSNVAVAGSAVMLAGVLNIIFALQFRVYKSAIMIANS
jgi:uncharacterized membrane protein HdeD (DUF308 family)